MQKSEIIIYSKEDNELIKEFNLKRRVYVVNKGEDNKISLSDLLTLIKRQNKRCYYCNDRLKAEYYQIDHFYSKYLGGKTVSNNLVATCRWCNSMKHSLDGFAFIRKCYDIFNNNHLKMNGIIDEGFYTGKRVKEKKSNRRKNLNVIE